MARTEVLRYVEQVVDGSEYKGYVEIAAVRFEYKMTFNPSIDQLDKIPIERVQQEIRQIFQITVSKDGKDLELTLEEYGIFYALLAEFVVSFYNSPQTRDNNEGLLGEAIRQQGPLGNMVKVTIAMTSHSDYELPPSVREIFNSPKFGCAIAV